MFTQEEYARAISARMNKLWRYFRLTDPIWDGQDLIPKPENSSYQNG